MNLLIQTNEGQREGSLGVGGEVGILGIVFLLFGLTVKGDLRVAGTGLDVEDGSLAARNELRVEGQRADALDLGVVVCVGSARPFASRADAPSSTSRLSYDISAAPSSSVVSTSPVHG